MVLAYWDATGSHWLSSIRLGWKRILSIRTSQGLQSILEQHKDVFKSELGTLNGAKAKIRTDPQVKHIFYKARTVPLAFRQEVEREFERLEKLGIIEPVQLSNWAAPLVLVEKRDGNIRICGDYKLTVNQAAQTKVYPIPLIQEILHHSLVTKPFPSWICHMPTSRSSLKKHPSSM